MDIVEARQGPANEAQPAGPRARRDIFWTNALTALSEPSLDPLFWRAERLGSASAWWQHVPFAHWIVCATAPRILVELGTHTGVSYAAFCQAVERAGLATRCHAVDTWRGDPHAGLYGPEILDELRAFHDERFGAFSTLLQCTFDEALDHIDDGSIDLLHIDGLHTYDAVRHDFESWLPKLSGRAVVMFHDINVRSGDFGVWRLWAELRQQYPGFEFVHGHGLGVLAAGAEVPPPVAALCELTDPDAVAMIRTRFARLGEHWWMVTRERMLGQELGRSTAAANSGAEQLRAELAQQRAEAEQLRAVDEQLRAEAEQLRTGLVQQQAEAEGLRAEAEQLRTGLVQQQAEAEQLRAEAEQLRTGLVQQQAEVEGLRAEVARHSSEAEAAHAAAEHAWKAFRAASVRRSQAEGEMTELRARAEQAEARAQLAETEGGAAAARAAELDRALIQAWAERDGVLESTVWRATWPVRVAGRHLPAGLRRAVRGGAKLGWWTVTMKLPTKLRERREALQAGQPVHTTSARLPEEAPSYDPPTGSEDYSVPRPAMISQHVCSQSWVYVSGEPDTPGHHYRVLRPAAAAESIGVHTSWMRVEEITGRITEIEAADALVIWRAPWDERIESAINAARRGGAKVVFDVDDLMVVPELARLDVIDGIRTQNLTEEQVQEHYARMRQTMAAADLCLATTEELANHMRRMLMPTVVVPNGVDHAAIAASRLAARRRASAPDDGLIRIGYAGGTRTHQHDFTVCADAVASVLRSHPECRLVAFQAADRSLRYLDVDEFPSLHGLESQIEWRNYVPLEDLPNEVARFDINLAPLEVGNPYCEAKSELKLFEAALAGVPTIASPTGPFRRAIRHGETGFLAATQEEWQEALIQLLEDEPLRRRIARVAAREALWRFGPERRAELMMMVADLVLGGRRGARGFAHEIHHADIGLTEPRIPDYEIVFAADRLGTAEVTVVIPLYNYASYIEEALDSVRAQTLAALDLIVVEDCSTDNSFEVALRWMKANAVRFNRVLLLRNEANSGLAATRNAGFDAADTPYVLPLDADNRLLPNCVAECLRVARETSAAIAYPVIREFDHGHDVLGDRPFDPVRLQFGNYIDAMALISKAAWVAVGGYDRGRGGWEDYALLCQFVERGFWGERVPGGPLAEYRVHPTSMMKTSASQPEVMRRIIDEVRTTHRWLRLIQDPLASVPPKRQPALSASTYDEWVREADTLSDADRRDIKAHIATFSENPVISIIMVTYESNETLLRQAIASVRSQLYPYWELCVADDASSSPHVSSILAEAASADARIKWVRREKNSHIVEATNAALSLATGPFVALMDHDDLLAEQALYEVAVLLNAHPNTDLIYTDEDQIDEAGQRHTPYFKPDWNYDLFLSHNTVRHLGVYRRSLVERLGGMRVGFEGCQDYDLALRVVAATASDRIRHIPAVLYHWRQAGGSSFSELDLDRCTDAARRAIGEHLRSMGGRAAEAKVLPHPTILGSNRVCWRLPSPSPRVSVIVPTRDRSDLLAKCVAGVLYRTDYPDIELIIVDNDSVEAETEVLLRGLSQDPRVRVLPFAGEFNYSAINNRAVEQATGDVVLLLNNDTVVIDANWLGEMVSHVMRPTVGAVGAKLLYEDDTIQHAGVVLGTGFYDGVPGVAAHFGGYKGRNDPGYFGQYALTRELSACTGACLAIRRAVYQEAGGLDEENLPVTFNDVDLCLRLRQNGYKIIWTPFAELYHLESASRGNDIAPVKAARFRREVEYMRARWGTVLENDPFYNPNFSKADLYFSLALSPLREKPWRNSILPAAARESPPKQSRSEMLLAPIPRNGEIVEIGPNSGPTARKVLGENTKTLDCVTRRRVIAKYTDDPDKAFGESGKLARMLSLLRCPDTGQALMLSPEGDALISGDGSRRWPLVMGRPVLFPGMEVPIINSDAHLSNPLPESALAMIHSTSGPILHLSAGGTAERFEHVIEAEAAVFRHTDLICDSHHLPFKDQVFEAVIALNAFEHYRDPWKAAHEIQRVLRPGGRVLIHTAFLQPLHEAPWHFYNCTRYGLEAWFKDFEAEKLHVSENLHPGYSLSWLASECEVALRSRLSDAVADTFLAAPLHEIVSFWRRPERAKMEDLVWNSLAALPQDAQEGLAAGFEFIGRKPLA